MRNEAVSLFASETCWQEKFGQCAASQEYPDGAGRSGRYRNWQGGTKADTETGREAFRRIQKLAGRHLDGYRNWQGGI